MYIKKIFAFLVLSICVTLFADYSLDSNSDGNNDILVEELSDGGVIISRDTDYDGSVDTKLGMDKMNLSQFEETDYNLDGIMDNFHYFEDGFIVRQEIDSNYDQKIDVWVHITNEGQSIIKYEKDLDFDGIVDKVKEFEVYKEDGQ